MTATHDVDRLLATWFAADATETAPAGLVEAIAGAIVTTRRRPGWLSPDRWLPVLPQVPTAVRVAALAALLLAVAIASLIVAGTRPRVPPPFGPAKPGLFAMSIDGDIVTMAPDGGPQHALTSGDAWDSNPTFSRDGTRLAFWSWPSDSNLSDLVVMDADGSDRHKVAQAAFFGRAYDDGPAVAWSPDGRSIAYSVSDVNQSRIFVAGADGQGSVPVGDPAIKAGHPAWSPDGSLIAFNAGAFDHDRGVYRMRPDGTDIRRITATPGYASDFIPTWSPDGRHLAFTTLGGFTGEGKGENLWMVDVDASNEHLVDAGSFVGSATWSPDGQRLAWLHAVADLSKPAEIDVADADGRNIQRFANDALPQFGLPYDSYSPCVGWTADGRRVVAILTNDNSVVDRLIEIDPDGGDPLFIDAPGMRAWTQQRLAP